tara:strand:- start:89 stop:349 length:261 start_codon:yes stop_codon:yes gene_type:complete
MKIFLCFFLIFTLNACTTYVHKSGNNSNLNSDSRFCQATANIQAPTYICRAITFCAPDETAIAIQALAQNNAVYDQCMMSKGYVPQ